MSNVLIILFFFFSPIFNRITLIECIGGLPRSFKVSRFYQSIAEVTLAVSLIGLRTIRRMGNVDLPEIFRLVPSFYLVASASFIQNTNHVLSYFGMSTNYSRSKPVLINGRFLYICLYDGEKLRGFSHTIADIERIEIIRSRNSDGYDASTFFDKINLIHKILITKAVQVRLQLLDMIASSLSQAMLGRD